MTTEAANLADVLKSHGYSATAPRGVVFEMLQDHEPQTMGELIAACRGKLDRASVYRTVALFEELGIVQRLQIGWKYKLELSDRFSHHHHHLSCIKCGKVTAIHEDAGLEARITALANAQNFQPIDHQFEVRGICAACQVQ